MLRATPSRLPLRFLVEETLDGAAPASAASPGGSTCGTGGRTRRWVKVKCFQRDRHEPVGLHRIGCARRPSSRHRGLRRQRRNRFPRSRSVRVQKADGSHQTAEIQVEQNRQSVAWIKPTLIAEIAFRAWTSDLKLRHTSYKEIARSAGQRRGLQDRLRVGRDPLPVASPYATISASGQLGLIPSGR